MTTEKTTQHPRVGTIVWGLVCLTVAGLVLSAVLFGAVYDPVVAMILVLIGAGVALVIGGIVSASRGRAATGAAPTTTEVH